MLKAIKLVFLCILLNKNYYLKAKLMKTIYHVAHACIEFALKISDRKKSFSPGGGMK